MSTPALRYALDHHITDVIRVLQDVPTGCQKPHTCQTTGICYEEVRESACFN